jgi:hypothetical protein
MRTSLRELGEARAIHLMVRAALRLTSAPRALRYVSRFARRLRPLEDLQQARRFQRALGRSGSCLSRALAVAARVPGAEVVIGVDPWGSSTTRAHAWVELDGERVDAGSIDSFGFGEMARLRVGR